MEGLWVWAGITIPWFIQDTLWAVNVRRPLPTHLNEDKYKLIEGSRRKGNLYWVDHVQLGTTIMFVEGEFDCLLIWQLASDLISPIILGSATNRLHSRWYPHLIGSPRILVLEDNDAAGQQMGQRLGMLSQRVRRLQMPNGKDVTDYYTQLGVQEAAAELQRWLDDLLPHHATERMNRFITESNTAVGGNIVAAVKETDLEPHQQIPLFLVDGSRTGLVNNNYYRATESSKIATMELYREQNMFPLKIELSFAEYQLSFSFRKLDLTDIG
jgi:hypothetical protein